MTLRRIRIFFIFAAVVIICSGTANANGPGGVGRVRVNGAELAYVERGRGDLVVLVHGAVSDYRTWAAQTEALSRHFRVVSYSRRYHHPGGQAGGGPEYTRTLHAADLAALIRALGGGPAHLIGHSYGGSVAAMVAAEHPELVRSLVLGEPSIFSVMSGEGDRALFERQKAELAAVRRASEGGEDGRAARGFVKTMVGADVFDSLPEATRAVVADNARTLGPMLKTYSEEAVLDCVRLGGVRAPALLVLGELSPEINRRVAVGLGRCLPESRLYVLEGASHGLQIEKPEEFNRAVLDFLLRRGLGK